MIPRLMLAVLGLLLLTGCARTVWYKDGATQVDFNRDA